jgi:hypothetical protein
MVATYFHNGLDSLVLLGAREDLCVDPGAGFHASDFSNMNFRKERNWDNCMILWFESSIENLIAWDAFETKIYENRAARLIASYAGVETR